MSAEAIELAARAAIGNFKVEKAFLRVAVDLQKDTPSLGEAEKAFAQSDLDYRAPQVVVNPGENGWIDTGVGRLITEQPSDAWADAGLERPIPIESASE